MLFEMSFEMLFKRQKTEPVELYNMRLRWEQVDYTDFIADLAALEAIFRRPEVKKKGCLMGRVFSFGAYGGFALIIKSTQVMNVTVDKEIRNEIYEMMDRNKLKGVSAFEMVV